MLNLFTTLFINLIKLIDLFFKILFKIDFYGFLNDKIFQRFQIIFIAKKKLKFLVPNHITKWRIDTFFEKEPETLEWIKKFEKNKKIIFWDIGSNIGIYSIYAAVLHKKINIYAFEPSFLNLHILSRNIHINKLNKKINIFQLPLTNKKNKFQYMNESTNSFGGALSSFGSNKNQEGKKTNFINSYAIVGTTLDSAVDSRIIELPDYIKIDVDGLEHIILNGFSKHISNKRIKSILVEITENYKEQKNYVENIMRKSNFVLQNKEQSEISRKGSSKTFNYIYYKKI